MAPTPTVNSGLMTLQVPKRKRRQVEESQAERGKISEAVGQAGKGSTSSLSRTALLDSRQGGVGWLAVSMTQVSVGSQGQPSGRSPDRQAGQLQLSPQLSSLLGMQRPLLKMSWPLGAS